MTEKNTESTEATDIVNEMFTAGAHYGYSRSRRHPSMKKMMYGMKGKVEVFDLEKTSESLTKAEAFAASLAKEGKKILFVGTKNEGRAALKAGADKLGMPYVVNRWIGGTLTNFSEIKIRIARLEDLTSKKEKGELGMYTKKERLVLDEEIERLERNFGGLVGMGEVPTVMFIIDPRKEFIAFNEAKVSGMTIISLANSDCDISKIDFPIAANDGSQASITLFINKIVDAYEASKGKQA